MFHGHFRDFNIIILLMLTQPPSPHPCFWNTDANDYFSFSAVLHWLSLMSGRWIIAESDPFIHYSPFICINKITFIFQFLACLSSFLLFFFFYEPFFQFSLVSWQTYIAFLQLIFLHYFWSISTFSPTALNANSS